VPRRMFEPHNEEVTESWRVAHNMELCTEIWILAENYDD
jgi:hypothetical protein